ncbi:MAG: NTP transferase domain-containing protein [Oligoflexales bacterium]|nr:NTP transferase domain-containing protein [Oligoflexales bacterium]
MANSLEAYAVVLAGGSGTRFWPKSRIREPKQLCKIGSAEKTMIELTLDRLDGFIPPERRIIVTHHLQVQKTREIVGNKAAYYIAEPEAKNTAAALTLAALEVKQIAKTDKVVMFSFHADHVVDNTIKFQETLTHAKRLAEEEKLALLGIVPDSPATGYGYIEKGEPFLENGSFLVSSFKEKPDLETAKKYQKSGNYYWNSGIFTWRVDLFLHQMKEYLPRTLSALQSLQDQGGLFSEMPLKMLASVYETLQNIAIDHAVLELSDKTAVVKAHFKWKDVGSWDALDQCFESDSLGNLVYGKSELIDCKSCTIDSDGPLIAGLGLENMVIVAAKGAVLVCQKSRSEDVKKIVERLKSSDQAQLT